MQIDSVAQHRASFLQDKLPSPHAGVYPKGRCSPTQGKGKSLKKLSMLGTPFLRPLWETTGPAAEAARALRTEDKPHLCLGSASWSQQPGLHLHQELQTSNESIHLFNMS